MKELTNRCIFSLLALVLLAASCSKNEMPQFDATVANSCPKGNLEVVAYAGGTLHVIGWALDPEDGVPVARIVVYVDNKIVGNGTTGMERQDVASFFKNPGWSKAGWEIKNKLSLPKGKHVLSVVVYDKMEAVTKLNEKEFNVN